MGILVKYKALNPKCCCSKPKFLTNYYICFFTIWDGPAANKSPNPRVYYIFQCFQGLQITESWGFTAFLQCCHWFVEMKNPKNFAFLQCFSIFLELKQFKTLAFLQCFQRFLQRKIFNTIENTRTGDPKRCSKSKFHGIYCVFLYVLGWSWCQQMPKS